MAYGIYEGIPTALCPHCGEEAQGTKEINKVFGYRTCDNKPQSWCKECRTYSSHLSRLGRGKRKEARGKM